MADIKFQSGHKIFKLSPQKFLKSKSIAKLGCGRGDILVIFSDFGRRQPKKHFFLSILALKGAQM